MEIIMDLFKKSQAEIHMNDKKKPYNKPYIKLNIKRKRFIIIKLSIVIFTILLNIISWNSSSFSDWYIANILPFWTNTYSRLMNLFPTSVGEKLIILSIILVISGIIIFLLGFMKSMKLKAFRKIYWNIMSWIIVIVFLIQTLNCFILYHATTFEEQYINTNNNYGFDELTDLREHVVKELNSLSTTFERNEKGEIIYDTSEKDLYAECIKSMRQLGKKYHNLSGYYPNPKKILLSDFMSQQYLSGIYFPFTLEANYNTSMYITNIPFTICHELAHLKGYIYEDEANFIAFMACIESGNSFLQYSGYLGVLGYISNDFRENADEDAWNSRTLITEEASYDNIFLTADTWNKLNKTSLFKTKTVQTISNKMMDSSLKLNGIKDGINSYNRVVQLLIYYYKV